MLKNRIVWLCLVIFSLCTGTSTIADVPANEPVKDFPLGVYWPWERTGGVAKNAGMEQWQFVKNTCRMLKDNGTDTIWIVNIGVDDVRQFLKISRPMGLKILPCLVEVEIRNHPETAKVVPDDAASMQQALDYYQKTIPQIVQSIGEDKDGILAWVLGDEPSGNTLSLLDPMRKIFAEADPGRPVTTVTIWPVTPQVIEKTKLTTFCLDIYPFFGQNCPNGPHTTDASTSYYTVNIQRMVDAAGKDGRVGWAMPQCFNEIWGPWELKPDGSAIALPGSYINWRTPTEGEVRWQTWEALRCGAKGVIFFVLLSPDKGDPTAPAITDPTYKDVIAKKPVVDGPNALLDFKGRLTPQFKAMSKIFKQLSPQKDLIRRLMPSSVEWLMADSNAKVANFTDPLTNELYAVVVNTDITSKQRVAVIASPEVKEVIDVLSDRKIDLTNMGWAGGNRRAMVVLKPGDGAFIRVKR